MRRSSFRGHMVHDDAPTAEARIPDPDRMVQAYNHATATLNLVRAFTKGGFADLMRVHEWNQEFVASSPEGRRYEQLASEIERALRFMAACGIDLSASRSSTRSTSGRATRASCSTTRRPHPARLDDRRLVRLLGAHALDRGAHAPAGRGPRRVLLRRPEPARGEGGADGDAGRDPRALRAAQPRPRAGALTLIARMGAEKVFDLLPPILRAVRDSGQPVLWASDPMHANVFTTESGFKTRRFDAIMAEIEGFFAACRKERASGPAASTSSSGRTSPSAWAAARRCSRSS